MRFMPASAFVITSFLTGALTIPVNAAPKTLSSPQTPPPAVAPSAPHQAPPAAQLREKLPRQTVSVQEAAELFVNLCVKDGPDMQRIEAAAKKQEWYRIARNDEKNQNPEKNWIISADKKVFFKVFNHELPAGRMTICGVRINDADIIEGAAAFQGALKAAGLPEDSEGQATLLLTGNRSKETKVVQMTINKIVPLQKQ